jgi:Uma2 family endonuclease
MHTDVIKKRFTVDEYHRMGETGFGPEDRLELIDGEILEMSPIRQRHAARVARATTLFVRAFAERVSSIRRIRCSSPIGPNPAGHRYPEAQGRTSMSI